MSSKTPEASTQSTILQIKNTRKYILELVNNLTVDQLNKVPEGFNNNIIWNIAHLTAAQQNMCYLRSGLSITVEDEHFSPFLSGTKPEKFFSKPEIDSIYEVLLTSLDQLEEDYSKGIFKQFDPWDKRYGMKLISIEDAINFVPFHEGMHLGYIMALKKLV